MNGIKTAIISAIVLVFIGAALWFAFSKDGSPDFGSIRPSELTFGAPYEGAPLTGDYKNEKFRFALDVPEGFTTSELPEDENGSTTIIIQNEKGEGIQIFITPTDEGQNVLSAEQIRADIPDMKVDDVETVEIGSDYTGVAFRSDNDAFEKNSREVWFYFRGNLYQISTYARLDGLLKAMFSTWKFY